MKSMLSRKITIGKTLLITLVTIAVTYFATNYANNESIFKNESSSYSSLSSKTSGSTLTCNYNLKRLNGYNYIKPLMFVDNECEGEDLSSVKQNITKIIDGFKVSGDLISASVYLKDYSKNEWMGINENEKYNPGSLLKVPELITFLKMDEDHPGVLGKKLVYNHPFITDKKPIILSQSIQLGHTYTIKELLMYMIAFSDNNATQLLNANIDVNTFKKIFTDLGLEAPDWNSSDYPISAKDYSLFMRVLYNASYLSNEDSEFAAELLSKSDFRNGIIKDLPSYLQMAHKFGESGNGKETELHESAIIYMDKRPYLLTVMTRGNDIKKLPQVLSQISDIIYQSM